MLLAVALAGCLAGPGPRNGGPAGGETPVTRQPGVEDPARYELRVTADTPAGPPIEGATVVFFNATDRGDRFGDGHWAERYYVNGTEWPCGETMDLTASPEWNVLAVGQTGPEGRIVGLVDNETSFVSVAVGGVDGYTTEVNVYGLTQDGACVPASYVDDPWANGTQTLPLYHDHHRVAVDGTFNASASAAFLPGDVDDPARLSEPVWDTAPLRFAEPGLPNLRHLDRLRHLDLTLAWNDTATEHADLTPAAGDGDPAIWGTDARQLPGSGPSRETLTRSLSDRTLLIRRVGPVANATVVTPDGLDWRIAGEATFAGVPVVLPGSG